MTHVAAGTPWVRRGELHTDPCEAEAFYLAEFRVDAPAWAVAITHVAPTLIGAAFATIVLAWLVIGAGQFPTAIREQCLWMLLGSWWLIYTTPSKDDLDFDIER
jgi:hypothetical protein